jgi:L-threonylcarbamoyladenylate synthase
MLTRSLAALERGEVIAVPTEAVFGLSADPRNLDAVQAVLNLKKRDPNKGFILVASSVSQLEPYLENIPEHILSSWPGPVTWVVPAKKIVSPLLRGKHNSIAVRVTAHPVLSALCTAYGSALVSTSANPEGLPPALTHAMLQDYFGESLLITPGELGGRDKPTEIRDALTGDILRL